MKKLSVFFLILCLAAGAAVFSSAEGDNSQMLLERMLDRLSGMPGQEEEPSDVLMEACLLDDLPAHRLLIPGEEGTSIYIDELHASYPVADGYAVLEIPDHIWYDTLENPPEEMVVTLTPFRKDISDRLTKLPSVSYLISIPSSPVTLESPENLRTVVTTVMAPIKITVRPGSIVTVNGMDCSDTVNSGTGEMTYYAAVRPIGDNEFTITVRSPHCRESTLRVVLFREPQEIPLDMAAAAESTAHQNKMKITATTLPGASVAISTPYSDLDVSELDATGKFTFNAVFDHIGDNHIIITASYPGKKPSVIDHTVYYVPSVDVYTRKAWPLDAGNYADLLGRINILAAQSQVYVIKGTVQYQISDHPQIVVIYSGEDGKSQPVVLENQSGREWTVGVHYRIYADVSGSYNGMPYLIGRYTYAYAN